MYHVCDIIAMEWLPIKQDTAGHFSGFPLMFNSYETICQKTTHQQ